MSAMPIRWKQHLARHLGLCLMLAAPQVAAGRAIATTPFLTVGERADAPAGYLAMCASSATMCENVSGTASSDTLPDNELPVKQVDGLGSTAAIVPGSADRSAAKAASGAALATDWAAAWATALSSPTSRSHGWGGPALAGFTPPLAQVFETAPRVSGMIPWSKAFVSAASDARPSLSLRPGSLSNSAGAPAADIRLADLKRFNRVINNHVVQREDIATYGVEELWRPSGSGHGAVGDCEDIALEKQIEISRLGLPLNTARLAVVYHRSLGLHVVLVVRTVRGDMVLDSATNAVRRWSDTPYQWLRVQDGTDRMLWQKLA